MSATPLGQVRPNPVDHLDLIALVVRRLIPFHRRVGIPLNELDEFQVGAIALIKACNRFDTSRGREIGPYAYVVIRGEILNHWRAERKHYRKRAPVLKDRSEGEREHGVPEGDAFVSHDPPPIDDELHDEVSKALDSLSPTQSQVIRMKVLAGKTCREAAEALHSAVENARVRGMTQLRKLASKWPDALPMHRPRTCGAQAGGMSVTWRSRWRRFELSWRDADGRWRTKRIDTRWRSEAEAEADRIAAQLKGGAA